MNLEDIPSSPSASHPITGLQQIGGLDGACCSLGWRSVSDLILSLLSDVYILLGPPGPWSLQIGPLAVFLYCSAPRDTFCWAQAVELDLLLGTRSPGCLHCSG